MCTKWQKILVNHTKLTIYLCFKTNHLDQITQNFDTSNKKVFIYVSKTENLLQNNRNVSKNKQKSVYLYVKNKQFGKITENFVFQKQTICVK